MSKATSFRDYVRSRRAAADHTTGEFIAMAKEDKRFPSIKSWGELRRYLNGRGEPHEIMVAARAIWRDYKLHLRE